MNPLYLQLRDVFLRPTEYQCKYIIQLVLSALFYALLGVYDGFGHKYFVEEYTKIAYTAECIDM